MNVFGCDTYLRVLNAFLAENAGYKGIKTKLSQAAGCNLSYLSHVLSEKAHFTLDHAFGASEFMELNGDEKSYFLLLVQKERASTQKLKEHLSKELNKTKSRNFKVSKKMESKRSLSEIEAIQYSSDWLLQAVHMALTIQRFSNFEKLKTYLDVGSDRLRLTLEKLERLGLIEFNKKEKIWKTKSTDIHIPSSSVATIQRHLQWKMKSIEDLQQNRDESVHYEATFSMSENDFNILKGEILEFIESSRETVLKSTEEQVVHLGLDFFKLDSQS